MASSRNSFSIEAFRGRAALRNLDEENRRATYLELFFDLVFVVAIIALSQGLHDGLLEGRYVDSLMTFAFAFFAIWWSWMNYTWFASAHDSDDVSHRLLTLVQIAGVLVIASGIPTAFESQNITVMTIGYGIMRLGLIASWLRVALHIRHQRDRALRYTTGLVVVQTLWFGRLGFDESVGLFAVVPLIILELAIPYWAERRGDRPFHPDHIEERYGLFTLILLGEVILSASYGLRAALDIGQNTPVVVLVGFCGLMMTFGCWWLYFYHPGHLAPERNIAFRWGYGHSILFAALAAMGSGLYVAMDAVANDGDARLGAIALSIPPAAYLVALVGLLFLTGRTVASVRVWPKLVAAVVILALGLFAGQVVTSVGIAIVFTALVISMIAYRAPEERGSQATKVGI
jgi:low temperature requirement protein LtrA